MMEAIHIVHPGYWVYSMPHSGFLSSNHGGWGAKHQAGGDASSPAFSVKVALSGFEVAGEALMRAALESMIGWGLAAPRTLFIGLTVLELERALFWGGLWFHAFKTAVLTAVVAAAGMAACSRST